MAAGDKLQDQKNNNNKMKNMKHGILPQKEFKERNSLLTDLYEIDHFKSVRHCFVAAMITAIMSTMICDIFESGSLAYGVRYIIIGFGQFHRTIIIWIVMFIFTFAVYPVFCLWAKLRMKLHPKSFFLKLWDHLWLTIFLIYFGAFLYFPPYFKGIDLPIASSAVILGEQIRMLMKTHAFVRSNVPRVKKFKQHSEKDYPVPTFSKYFYYLFIPTFVYKDKYPRTKEIRWTFVFTNFLEVATAIFFYNFLTINYLVPDFKNYGLEPRNWRTNTSSVLRMILPCSMMMLTGFYIILHSWMNAWAEMLRFADRLFYLDWWNSATYSAYYRKWNIVVHDYLHEYIYRDIYEIILPGNKVFATCMVFLVSAAVHEYVIAVMLGFFFPVMFVQFSICGIVLTLVKVKGREFIGNTFLWWSLSVGIGLQISLYTMEYHARANCPQEINSFRDYFIPRIMSCNKA